MSIQLDLQKEQAKLLESTARRLGVDARDLARAAVADLLAQPREDFQEAAELVLKKNSELYRRLA